MARKSAKATIVVPPTTTPTADDAVESLPLAQGERRVSDVFPGYENAPQHARIYCGMAKPEGAPTGVVTKKDLQYTWSKPNVQLAQQIAAGVASKYWLLDGPPGCGKTEFAYQFAACTGRAITVLECHEGIEADALFSFLEPTTEASSSGFARVDGPITKAMRNGDLLVLDELKGLRPAVQMALYNALDGRPVLIRHTGTLIEPHPEFRVIATVNDVADEKKASFKGAFPLTDPLKSRFAGKKFAAMLADAEIEALRRRVPGMATPVASLLVSIATSIRSEAANGGMREISFRELLVACRLIVSSYGVASDNSESGIAAQMEGVSDSLDMAYGSKESKAITQRVADLARDALALRVR